MKSLPSKSFTLARCSWFIFMTFFSSVRPSLWTCERGRVLQHGCTWVFSFSIAFNIRYEWKFSFGISFSIAYLRENACIFKLVSICIFNQSQLQKISEWRQQDAKHEIMQATRGRRGAWVGAVVEVELVSHHHHGDNDHDHGDDKNHHLDNDNDHDKDYNDYDDNDNDLWDDDTDHDNIVDIYDSWWCMAFWCKQVFQKKYSNFLGGHPLYMNTGAPGGLLAGRGGENTYQVGRCVSNSPLFHFHFLFADFSCQIRKLLEKDSH